MKKCPFCGKEVKAKYPFIGSCGGEAPFWNFSHHCNFSGDLTVVIDVWGSSEEECIERWNTRAENETSESV
jgi:hypothetical protein